LIIELFNFFVAMTKESHLAHIIVASSDGYFINTVYNDSRLKKTSVFYKVDYLEKYSKIKNFTLTEGDVEKIWDVPGGSMWEIQDLLSQLFENSLDESLSLYKKKMLGIFAYYTGFNNDRKEIFKLMGKICSRPSVDVHDFLYMYLPFHICSCPAGFIHPLLYMFLSVRFIDSTVQFLFYFCPGVPQRNGTIKNRFAIRTVGV